MAAATHSQIHGRHCCKAPLSKSHVQRALSLMPCALANLWPLCAVRTRGQRRRSCRGLSESQQRAGCASAGERRAGFACSGGDGGSCTGRPQFEGAGLAQRQTHGLAQLAAGPCASESFEQTLRRLFFLCKRPSWRSASNSRELRALSTRCTTCITFESLAVYSQREPTNRCSDCP